MRDGVGCVVSACSEPRSYTPSQSTFYSCWLLLSRRVYIQHAERKACVLLLRWEEGEFVCLFVYLDDGFCLWFGLGGFFFF